LARSLADFGQVEAYGIIGARLFNAWSAAERDNKKELTEPCQAALTDALEAEGHKLREAAGRMNATILVSIDQAEEIARTEGDSSDALSDYLRIALASAGSGWQVAFTIRTDSFPELQKHRRFENLNARGYDVRALPAFRFGDVIEKPAKRYGVIVGQNLAHALIRLRPALYRLGRLQSP
jgi:hypothetical protein